MDIKELLDTTVEYFKKYGLKEPRLDAEVLLAHVLKKEGFNYTWILISPLMTEVNWAEYRQPGLPAGPSSSGGLFTG